MVNQAGSPGFRIAVATYPTGLDLAEEIRFVKPGLIYGDTVTLQSPAATMLLSAGQFATLDDDGKVRALTQILPTLAREKSAESLRTLEAFDQLRRKKHLAGRELNLRRAFEKQLRSTWDEIRQTVEELTDRAGGKHLVRAIAEGVLVIDPLIGTEPSQGLSVETYMERIEAALSDVCTYPLFGPEVAKLIDATIGAGGVVVGATAEGRAKQAALAAGFLNRLPAFPDATVDEILDVRKDLEDPLIRFRGAMVAFATELSESAFGDELGGEIQDLWFAKVAPHLADLKERVAENHALRQLAGLAVDSKTGATASIASVSTIGFEALRQPEHLPALLAATVPAVLGATLAAEVRRRKVAREIRRDSLYLLYRADELLGGS